MVGPVLDDFKQLSNDELKEMSVAKRSLFGLDALYETSIDSFLTGSIPGEPQDIKIRHGDDVYPISYKQLHYNIPVGVTRMPYRILNKVKKPVVKALKWAGLAALVVGVNAMNVGDHKKSYDNERPGIVSTVAAEERTVNDYTFDYNPDGWEVPKLYDEDGQLAEGVKYLGERMADVNDEIPGKDTLTKGYKLNNGRVVTTYERNGFLFAIKFNSFNGKEGYYLTNISPYSKISESFDYKYSFHTKAPSPQS